MHRRPTVAHIDLGALEHNYLELRKIAPGTPLMAVVKADAYGHGAVEVAARLETLGCSAFGVAIPEEGEELRAAGIKGEITVLGGIFADQAEDIVELGLTPVVFDMATAKALDRAARGRGAHLGVHVKVDTGMGRLGVQPGDAPAFFNELKGLENLRVLSLLTHFAESESDDREFTERQLSAFLKTAGEIRQAGGTTGSLDAANSAALAGFEASRLDMARPGIMLYGAYPAERLRASVALRPVMTLKTRILHLKEVPSGFTVSYSRRFTTKRPSKIATLPIGYADGVPRALGNTGEVLVGGSRAPVAGTVCMDLMMIDATDIPGVRQGDEAVLIGTQGKETITAEEAAQKAGTISYEIFCRVSARVPRVYAR